MFAVLSILFEGITFQITPEPLASEPTTVPPAALKDLSGNLNDYFSQKAILITPFKKVDIDGRKHTLGLRKITIIRYFRVYITSHTSLLQVEIVRKPNLYRG
jgi:hypothetical protein